MVLPDALDSGNFSGGRSNFSQTCNLLSKYLKEKGTFPDLKLGLTTDLEPKGANYSTVNLLGGVGNETEKKSEPGSAQMTIFYAGQVIVFDDFPADKAKQIVMLASTSSSTAVAQNYLTAAVSPPVAALSPTESTASIQKNILPSTALDSDLPIARKNSLSRFLEKRKDRITANAPYQTSKPAAALPKAAKGGEAWLGMAPSLGQWSSGH